MRICIFGAGSLGCALGGILAGKNKVTLIGRKRNINAILENGLRIIGDSRSRIRLEARETCKGIDPPELLVISTKAFDTAEAIKSCNSWLDQDTMVLTLQNGLGNLELLRDWKGRRAFGGTTTMGAAMLSPGVVRVSGLGRTVIGSDLDLLGAKRIASSFESSGFTVGLSRNIIGEIWSKAVVNACINPTAAILRITNGRLIESSIISHFMRDVSIECENVASAFGVNLPGGPSHARVRAVCRDTSNNLSSMLQDVLDGRKTEIDHINGAFCSGGDNFGISTPLNDALVAMIRSLHPGSAPEKG
jgi:2-dehydropantoate 2-reductase